MNKTARAFVSCLKPTEYYIVKVERLKKVTTEHPFIKGTTYEKTVREEVYNGIIWTNEQLHAFERGLYNYYEKRYTQQYGRPSTIPVFLDYKYYNEYTTYDHDYVITIKHR